ncbi:MAG: hypothetical protein KBC64_04130 [Simkaniaceae bacterium]|nr:hypothetical protein [Simkaniaceae bacterium]
MEITTSPIRYIVDDKELQEGIPLMPFGNNQADCLICASITFFAAEVKVWGKFLRKFPPKAEWILDGGVFSGEYAASLRKRYVQYEGGSVIPSAGAVSCVLGFQHLKSILIKERVLDLANTRIIMHSQPPIKSLLRKDRAVSHYIFQNIEYFIYPYTKKIPFQVGRWQLVAIIIFIPLHVFTLIREKGAWYEYNNDIKRRMSVGEVRAWVSGEHSRNWSRWQALMYTSIN